MRPINEINVHCSATRPSWMAASGGAAQVAEIRRWHVQENGWSDIGYHWIITRDGTVHQGRPEARPGAFEPKVNATAIGVCLIGGAGSTPNDTFLQHYSLQQEQALRQLIAEIRERIPAITKVTGHNDYAAKACPGFKVDRWLIGAPPRALYESKTLVGAAVGAVGTAAQIGLAFQEDIAKATQVVQELQAVAPDSLDAPLRVIIGLLALAGIALAAWSRWTDWKRGRQ